RHHRRRMRRDGGGARAEPAGARRPLRTRRVSMRLAARRKGRIGTRDRRPHRGARPSRVDGLVRERVPPAARVLRGAGSRLALRVWGGGSVGRGRDGQGGFGPARLMAVPDRTRDGGWIRWMRAFPPADGRPGDPSAEGARWTAARYMARTASLVAALVEGVDP